MNYERSVYIFVDNNPAIHHNAQPRIRPIGYVPTAYLPGYHYHPMSTSFRLLGSGI